MMSIVEMRWGSKVEMTVGNGKFVDRKGSDGHRENLIIHFKGLKKTLLQEGVQELTFLNTS